MAIINASELLDNIEAARLDGERLAVSKLGIQPEDFRNFCDLFVGGQVYNGRWLNRDKILQTVDVEPHGRKYRLIKTSYAKEFRAGHELHKRCIFDIRSTDWRFLFYGMSTGSNDLDIYQRINVNLPIGGRQFVYGIVCIGDQEAMQKEAVLLRMFKEHP